MTKKKIAIFVEGQTEQIFLYKLLTEVAGSKNIHFSCERMHSGSPGPTLWLQQANHIEGSPEYFALLVDCMGDETVKSTMLDRRDSLAKAGYTMILGIRDLYPKPNSELSMTIRRMAYGVPTAGVPTNIIVAVPEVESWFLQEYNHYSVLDPSLDYTTFSEQFGFDPSVDSAELVVHPAGLLSQIYSTVGLKYSKKSDETQRTVAALDYAHLYFNCPALLPQLNLFIQHVESFIG